MNHKKLINMVEQLLTEEDWLVDWTANLSPDKYKKHANEATEKFRSLVHEMTYVLGIYNKILTDMQSALKKKDSLEKVIDLFEKAYKIDQKLNEKEKKIWQSYLR